jgi:hypothetical protein
MRFESIFMILSGLFRSKVYSLRADGIENAASSISSTVACFFSKNFFTVVSASVEAKMRLQLICLATGILFDLTIPFSAEVPEYYALKFQELRYLLYVQKSDSEIFRSAAEVIMNGVSKGVLYV